MSEFPGRVSLVKRYQKCPPLPRDFVFLFVRWTNMGWIFHSPSLPFESQCRLSPLKRSWKFVIRSCASAGGYPLRSWWAREDFRRASRCRILRSAEAEGSPRNSVEAMQRTRYPTINLNLPARRRALSPRLRFPYRSETLKCPLQGDDDAPDFSITPIQTQTDRRSTVPSSFLVTFILLLLIRRVHQELSLYLLV